MSFAVGDSVMHSNFEVCVINDIRAEKFGNERKKYYVLKPVYDTRAIIYCPVDRADEMLRPLITKQDVEEIIACMQNDEQEWIIDDSLRHISFSEIIRGGDHEKLVGMIRSIYNRRKNCAPGKKIHLADERAMRDAEKVLYDEMAYVLGIMPDEVVEYIAKQVENL